MNFPTLMDLAGQVNYEGGEQTTHKTQLALYHAVQAVKRLAFDVSPQRRRAELTVSAQRTAQLPAEAVGLSALFTAGGQPVLTDLTPLGTRSGGAVSRRSTERGTATPDGPAREYGLATPATNTAGHYRADPYTGLLTLSADCPAQPGDVLVAIYSVSGVAASGETLVHPWSEQFVISYVQYKMMQPLRSVSSYDKEEKKQEWKSELRLTAKRFNRFTRAEWEAALMGRQRRTL